jgi:hypothetical protein
MMRSTATKPPLAFLHVPRPQKSGRPFSGEAGLADGAASGCAILCAAQAFQSLSLIFLQRSQRPAAQTAKEPRQSAIVICSSPHKATVDILHYAVVDNNYQVAIAIADVRPGATVMARLFADVQRFRGDLAGLTKKLHGAAAPTAKLCQTLSVTAQTFSMTAP